LCDARLARAGFVAALALAQTLFAAGRLPLLARFSAGAGLAFVLCLVATGTAGIGLSTLAFTAGSIGTRSLLLELTGQVVEFTLREAQRVGFVPEHGFGRAFDPAAQLLEVARDFRLQLARLVDEAAPQQLRTILHAAVRAALAV